MLSPQRHFQGSSQLMIPGPFTIALNSRDESWEACGNLAFVVVTNVLTSPFPFKKVLNSRVLFFPKRCLPTHLSTNNLSSTQLVPCFVLFLSSIAPNFTSKLSLKITCEANSSTLGYIPKRTKNIWPHKACA